MPHRYTVTQLARMAGVTARTLHHYDRIGLLKPSYKGTNGYRYYDEPNLYRLQQILFYRELDMPLDAIRRMLDSPSFDIQAALREHRTALQTEAGRIQRLIHTIEMTSDKLKGKQTMTDNQLFKGFTEAEQDAMADEAAERWDPDTVHSSNARWKKMSSSNQKRILDEGNAIYVDMIAAMSHAAGSAPVQAIVKRWHEHIQNFWLPNDEELIGLADLYNEDSKFRANFEAMKPGLAEFMRRAIQVYVAKRR